MASQLLNVDFPLTEDGRTMHLAVRRGDVNPRILSVGDSGRGERVSKLLENVVVITSSRGFLTYSGLFQGTPVSIIVTGMGIAMMDFVVRESTFCIDSNVAMIRLGTCGALKEKTKPGSLMVANSARFVQENYDYPDGPMFKVSKKVNANAQLESLLKTYLVQEVGEEQVTEGVTLTCETFYNAQGRSDSRFDDFYNGLIDYVAGIEDQADAMEMETFKLLHLASNSKGKLSAAACMIGIFNRKTDEEMDFTELHNIEIGAAKAALKALVAFNIDN